MAHDRVISLLGLAKRAGKLASGEFAVEKAVKSHRAYLVVVAADASDNTKKQFGNLCAHYRVPMRIYADKEMLGYGVGTVIRASLAVLDEGFARAVEEQMNTSKEKVGE